MVKSAAQSIRVLLDRYLEVSNHYSREIRYHLTEIETSPTRLDLLIGRLEAIEASTTDSAGTALGAHNEEAPLGQNIVRTPDTLAALRESADEVLERLSAPLKSVPRNLWWLRNWLQRDVDAIAAGFPSFTYAWDKLVDLNRLTLVPDARVLRIRDCLLVATIEFERFMLELQRLVAEVEPSSRKSRGAQIDKPRARLNSLGTALDPGLDPSVQARLARVVGLVERRESLGELLNLSEARMDADALGLLGIQLGFSHWLQLSEASSARRKSVIMSLIVCSKQFLVERSWQNAKDISSYAIALIARMNKDLDMDPAEGTAMLRFNQLWARHKLGEDIVDELESWDVASLHPRYSFLKSVLLRKFDDAVRLLETLLPPARGRELSNFSLIEADEWPILEELRSTLQYEELKQRRSNLGSAKKS